MTLPDRDAKAARLREHMRNESRYQAYRAMPSSIRERTASTQPARVRLKGWIDARKWIDRQPDNVPWSKEILIELHDQRVAELTLCLLRGEEML